MQPYYEAGGITIYHADCRDVLPQLPRGSVDLLLTDPPYGQSWQSGRRGVPFAVLSGDDSADWVYDALRLAVLTVRGRRHVYVFGRWDLAVVSLGGACELVWDKALMNAGALDSPWGVAHEYIQFGVVANAAQRRGGTGNGPARLRRASVLHYARLSGVAVTRHPTEKPVPLLRELIESSSRMGEAVLDPFMGVGSTLVAALLEGRQAIGIELEERYCETAAKRLEQARQAPLPLEVGA